MSAIDRMGQRLAALEPERLEIIDDSANMPDIRAQRAVAATTAW